MTNKELNKAAKHYAEFRGSSYKKISCENKRN